LIDLTEVSFNWGKMTQYKEESLLGLRNAAHFVKGKLQFLAFGPAIRRFTGLMFSYASV